ncbi:YfgG family protein [Chania multitudinisentens]|uniref:YfgG family protein n=1 Tax=Chania multitudinisentens TaxID=1639108 RepID=UPI0003E151CD|nr:YfgG family protein [Chania multitudinisentens]
MRKKTTGRITRIVLLISFIILVGRLLYAVLMAIPHHQEKLRSSESQFTETTVDNQ